jgi:ATP-dependent Lon protease
VSEPIQEIRLPDDFDGQVRLFPLPKLVMFPNVVQPLHVFEPRYCDLLQDAMLDDGLITLATLTPGWETVSVDKPKIMEIVCVGKVFSHMPTQDNRHNILLVGVQRAKIITEIDAKTAYRQAMVEPIYDIYDPSRDFDRAQRHEKLVAAYRHAFPAVSAAGSGLLKILKSGIPLGPLTDIISYSVEFPIELKAKLLSNDDVDARSDVLIRVLENWNHADEKEDIEPSDEVNSSIKETGDSGDDDYVPPFSIN